MASISWSANRSSVDVTLDDDELSYCVFAGNLRSELLLDGDPSMAYTTYEEQRPDNNIMSQKAELAFLRVLQSEKIPFSALCFTLTYVVAGIGVTAPLQDFALANKHTIDIKSDRYDIQRLGAIVPNEKLLDSHIASVTVWAECKQDSRVVTFHGWNNRQKMESLRNQPDAVQPNGAPMPKPCKRVPREEWQPMGNLINAIINRVQPYHVPLSAGVIELPQP